MLVVLVLFAVFLALLCGFRLLFAAVFATLLQGLSACAVAGALLRGLRFDGAGKHLTYEALAYLDLTSLPVFAGAFALHPWVTGGSLLATAAAGWGAWAGFGLLLRRPLAQDRPRLPLASAASLFAFGMLAIFVVARGGVQSLPIGIGDANYSTSPYLNALALSPVYAALKTALAGESETFHYASAPANIAAVRRLFGIADEPGPTGDTYPLAHTAPGTPQGNRKNVVIFLLESWSGKDIGCLGATSKATPAFDALAKEGLLFPNFYASGIRTAEGLVSTLCAFPNQPVLPVLKRPVAFQAHWRALSQILAETGYNNIFIHGRDLDFDHVTGFLKLIHFDRILDAHSFPPDVKKTFSKSWPGYDDREVLEEADRVFTAQGSTPFFSMVNLMNTHPPFMTPPDFPNLMRPNKAAKRFLNSLRYSDDALGRYFERARRGPYCKDTIFVFVADHARTGDKFTLANQHHIPLLL